MRLSKRARMNSDSPGLSGSVLGLFRVTPLIISLPTRLRLMAEPPELPYHRGSDGRGMSFSKEVLTCARYAKGGSGKVVFVAVGGLRPDWLHDYATQSPGQPGCARRPRRRRPGPGLSVSRWRTWRYGTTGACHARRSRGWRTSANGSGTSTRSLVGANGSSRARRGVPYGTRRRGGRQRRRDGTWRGWGRRTGTPDVGRRGRNPEHGGDGGDG